MTKTTLTALFTLFLVALMFLPAAYATGSETVLVSVTDGVSTGYVGPENDYGWSRPISGNGQYLTTLSLEFSNNSAVESGTLRGVLMSAYTGNGTRVENSSNTYSLSNLNGATWINLTFSGAYQLETGVTYYVGWVLEGYAGTNFNYIMQISGTNYMKVGLSSSWTSNIHCQNFVVYTNDTSSGAPTPTPAPTAAPTDSSETITVINDFVGYLVPLILFMLPALILGWVTRWQKWPILIGLAIGGGLVYLFLGAQYIWLVILVVIGIGASAYQSSRGG